jgi:hypothetical protein
MQFTIQFWIRPLTGGTLLHIEKMLYIKIQSTMLQLYIYEKPVISQQVPVDKWYFIAFAATRNLARTEIVYHYNSGIKDTKSVSD